VEFLVTAQAALNQPQRFWTRADEPYCLFWIDLVAYTEALKPSPTIYANHVMCHVQFRLYGCQVYDSDQMSNNVRIMQAFTPTLWASSCFASYPWVVDSLEAQKGNVVSEGELMLS
jgi:hypothetical protein